VGGKRTASWFKVSSRKGAAVDSIGFLAEHPVNRITTQRNPAIKVLSRFKSISERVPASKPVVFPSIRYREPRIVPNPDGTLVAPG
jgi:hypothetical protein